jgi:hypothetical protein
MFSVHLALALQLDHVGSIAIWLAVVSVTDRNPIPVILVTRLYVPVDIFEHDRWLRNVPKGYE